MIEELIGIVREMCEASVRSETLGLTEDELTFYDTLGTNDSAVRVLDDETLRGIARELVETVRGNIAIDWTLREKCGRQSPTARQARPAQARVSARQAEEGDADGARTGGNAVGRLGEVMSRSQRLPARE